MLIKWFFLWPWLRVAVAMKTDEDCTIVQEQVTKKKMKRTKMRMRAMKQKMRKERETRKQKTLKSTID